MTPTINNNQILDPSAHTAIQINSLGSMNPPIQIVLVQPTPSCLNYLSRGVTWLNNQVQSIPSTLTTLGTACGGTCLRVTNSVGTKALLGSVGIIGVVTTTIGVICVLDDHVEYCQKLGDILHVDNQTAGGMAALAGIVTLLCIGITAASKK